MLFKGSKFFNSLPNGKILDWSKLKAFAEVNYKCDWKIEICFGTGKKHCGKRRKCWLPAFSPFFPLCFQAAPFSRSLKVGIVW